MKFLPLYLVVGFLTRGLALRLSRPLPEFSWSRSERSIHDVPLLEITFPDGTRDVALLKRFNPFPAEDKIPEAYSDNCIFDGNLRDDPSVYVTVLHGCPHDSTYSVMIPSDRLKGDIAFEIKDNIVLSASHKLAQGFSRANALKTKDEYFEPPPLPPPKTALPTSRVAFPPLGVVYNLRIFYDQFFKQKFGSDSLNMAVRLVAIAQNIYYWPTLRTSLRINLQAVTEIPLNMSISGSGLDILGRNYVFDNTTHFNYYFSFHNNAGGTVGLAYVGVSCYPLIYYRTGCGDYFLNDWDSAITLAHEGGHNFGARHDFADPYLYVGRRDANNQSCKNVGSVMDYYQDEYIIWSNCSAEFLQTYYDLMNFFNITCYPANLEPLPTSTTTTSTSTSTSTSTRTSTSTTTSSTSTPREQICKQANTAECNTICKMFNYDPKQMCVVKSTMCNCNFFGTPTTSATSAPATTLSTMDKKCVSDGRNLCYAECQAQSFSSIAFCRRTTPKLLCRCSLYS